MVGMAKECNPYWEDLFKQCLNMVIGIFALVVNLFIAYVILRNKQLRKETFILLAGKISGVFVP